MYTIKNFMKESSILDRSEKFVIREIENEIILIPLVSGIGSLEDDLISFNEIGKAIIKKINGERTIKEIIDLLIEEFDGSPHDIKRDTLGLLKELCNKGILVEKK
ncbi:MAG: PqqD family protein [Promethearchaeati archaeon]